MTDLAKVADAAAVAFFPTAAGAVVLTAALGTLWPVGSLLGLVAAFVVTAAAIDFKRTR